MSDFKSLHLKRISPKPSFCAACPINDYTEGYVPLERGSGTELWIGEAAGEDEATTGRPFVGGAGAWLQSMLDNARISRSTVNSINTIGCHPRDNVYPGSDKWVWTDRNVARQAVEYCRKHHLEPALIQIEPTRIVALGNEAMKAVTGRSGILQWRGSPLPLKGRLNEGPKVVPTLHPAYLMRQASMFSVAVRDLRRNLELPPERYDLWPTKDTVRNFDAKVFAFDFEWDEHENVTLCGLSDRYYNAIVVGFDEFKDDLKRIFEGAEIIIGHNIVDADTKYFERFGWNVTAKLHDTMLAQHLIQPDMRHGLAFVASVFTSKIFWKGQGEETEDEVGNILPTGAQWKTWDSPDAIPRQFGGYGGCHSAEDAWRLYNARDTDASFQAEGPIFQTLKEFNQEHVYWNVSVPAAWICRELNDAGLKIDATRLKNIREGLERDIAATEARLPEGLRPYEKPITKLERVPLGTFRPTVLKCKGTRKAGTTHDLVTWDVSTPGVSTCPSCGKEFNPKLKEIRTRRVDATKRVVPYNSQQQLIEYAKAKGCKEIPHVKTGNSSGDKRARRIWGREHTEFAIVDALKKLVTQRNSFAKEALVGLDRVHFRLAVTGTSEGRLSCSGVAPANLNLQNQPKVIRNIFIPDEPGYGMLSHDIVQGENMLTCWLAKDWERWDRLHQKGFDEHSYMASKFFNCEVDKDSPLRKSGKIINHGRNYGLGERKTQDYLAQEGFNYSIGDIREMINIWRKENKRTAEWQDETINLARKQSYLENPFGRRRWFQGRDFATKALAFLPASTLADMVLRMMIAHYPARFGSEIQALGLAVVADIAPSWRLALQVHDDLMFIGPDESHLEMARRTVAIMTQPWKELDGFEFKVESKYSTTSWGEAKVIHVS